MTMMNPETNMLEKIEPSRDLKKFVKAVEEATGEPFKDVEGKYHPELLDEHGRPVPKSRDVYEIGEEVQLKNYRYTVVGIETERLILKPLGPAARKKKVFNKAKAPKKKRRRG